MRGQCAQLRTPALLIAPLRRLKAQTSSAREGTYTTADKPALTEAGETCAARSETIAVLNYIRLLNWGINALPNVPLSGRFFRKLHRILMQGVGPERGQNKRPDAFKRDQTMISASLALSGRALLDSVRFVPPPPSETAQAISDLERSINRADKKSGLEPVDLALVHSEVEAIQSFDNGNGWVGKILF